MSDDWYVLGEYELKDAGMWDIEWEERKETIKEKQRFSLDDYDEE